MTDIKTLIEMLEAMQPYPYTTDPYSSAVYLLWPDNRDAILAALRTIPQWQPIGTAPKDGRILLLAKIVGHPDHKTALWWCARGFWSTKWNNWNDGVEPCGLAGPTHWQEAYPLRFTPEHPLRSPSPPAEGETE